MIKPVGKKVVEVPKNYLKVDEEGIIMGVRVACRKTPKGSIGCNFCVFADEAFDCIGHVPCSAISRPDLNQVYFEKIDN